MKKKDFTYTLVIIAAVILSLCFPKYFTEIGGYKLAGLITPLLQIIMFGMGTSMSVHDFAGVVKQPKGVIIGVFSHYLIMPLLGFTLASVSGLPPEIAAGIVLVGCSPNGLASNVISYLAKANLALSVTLTAVSTLLSPLLTPRLMKLLAGQMIAVDATAMTWDIMKMVIIPIGAGLIFNHFLHGRAKWLDKAMPKVSMAAIAVIITIITAAGRTSLLTIGPLLILLVTIHNLLGYCLGYWSGRLFKMNESDCRTMAIEVGMQNAGLASGLAKGLGKIATVGLAPAVFGPLMNVTGSLLASYWHRKPPKDRAPKGKPGPAKGGAAVAGTAVLLVAIAGMAVPAGCGRAAHTYDGSVGANWPGYGGNKAGNRYSPLAQVTPQNVTRLAVAWTYDAAQDADSNDRRHEIQCQPIVVDGVLYGTNPALGLFAVNAANGTPIWKFSAHYERMRFNTNRGVLYWEQGSDKRILYSAGSNLYAIDAATGKPVSSFGKNGIVDLHEGLGEGLGHPVDNLMVTATTPGVIYKNILVVGSSVSEGGDAAPGDVRGFDIPTGKLKWVFHTIPRPGEKGYETWPPDAYRKIGGANCWGGLVVDERRGLAFFGTGSPSVDFYGGARAGENLFANCIVAVHAETGRLAWYYQTVHHDLWDRDIPCPPNLVTVRHNGKPVDALVQTTKDGQVYVLDRDSGKSLFPVEERAVPIDGLPGEHPWATQRYPLKPAPLSRQTLADSDLTTLTPEAHAFAEKRFREIKRPYNKFLPPDTTGTLLLGYSGGAEWGGNATDPNGILYQNANEGFWDLQLFSLADWEKALANVSRGNALYMTNCSACHGRNRRGVANQFPDLTRTNRGVEDIQRLIATGSGKMPSFPALSAGDRKAIADYLLRPWAMPEKNEHSASEEVKTSLEPYVIKVWKNFDDPEGYPATRPPWGTLNAIDLNTGDYLWRTSLGEYPELVKKGFPATGAESYGGPLVTAGGLLFIAGTRDGKFRAFDPKTGKVLWEYQFPAGAYSTPITYSVDGKQYIAIADGGGRGGPFGGKYYAFALK